MKILRLLLGMLLLAQAFLYAEASQTLVYSSVSLIPEKVVVQPGETLRLALQFRLREGWHTYWRNPGDSGAALSLDWRLPEGFSTGEVRWPVPERIPLGPLVNYGYHDRLTVLVPLSVPETLREKSYSVSVTATWLVCADVCVPETATLSVTLYPEGENVAASGVDASLFQGVEAALPLPFPENAAFDFTDTDIALYLPLRTDAATVQEVYFFPNEPGIIEPSAEQHVEFHDKGITLKGKRGAVQPGTNLDGVLSVTTVDKEGNRHHYGYLVHGEEKASGSGFFPAWLMVLAFAFAGGLILNGMPCVLPVLSLKALSLVQKAHEEKRAVLVQAWSYAAGVLFCFLLLFVITVLIQRAGALIGWGFHLQSPGFVAVMAYLLFVIGLYLSGLFPAPLLLYLFPSFVGDRLKPRKDISPLAGSFMTGVLAVAVATPCTAPFMAPAVGFALSQPAGVMLTVFLALGAGFAFPFLIIGYFPALLRWIPKPGAWMETFKRFLAFPMYGAAIWLLWVLGIQRGVNVLLIALSFMLLLGFLGWVYYQFPGRSLLKAGALALTVAAGVWSVVTISMASPVSGETADKAKMLQAEMFDAGRIEDYTASGRAVFVDVTAAWCITCQVNEQTVLYSPRVREAFERYGVVYMVADWTNRDDAITRFLASFDRRGVPLYVFYAPGAEPVVLPQLLTERGVLDVLERSGNGNDR